MKRGALISGLMLFAMATPYCQQGEFPKLTGPYLGPLDAYKDDMAYLLKKAGKVNLAFIGKFQQAEWLKPGVVFPIHAGSWEYMYGAFARKAAEKKLSSRVVCPENKGDRFLIGR